VVKTASPIELEAKLVVAEPSACGRFRAGADV